MFTNAYTEEVYGSEHVRTSTKQLRVISYSKYEKENLHKVMETQCQHMTITQRKKFLKLFQKFEDLFDGNLAPGKQIQYTSN